MNFKPLNILTVTIIAAAITAFTACGNDGKADDKAVNPIGVEKQGPTDGNSEQKSLLATLAVCDLAKGEQAETLEQDFPLNMRQFEEAYVRDWEADLTLHSGSGNRVRISITRRPDGDPVFVPAIPRDANGSGDGATTLLGNADGQPGDGQHEETLPPGDDTSDVERCDPFYMTPIAIALSLDGRPLSTFSATAEFRADGSTRLSQSVVAESLPDEIVPSDLSSRYADISLEIRLSGDNNATQLTGDLVWLASDKISSGGSADVVTSAQKPWASFVAKAN